MGLAKRVAGTEVSYIVQPPGREKKKISPSLGLRWVPHDPRATELTERDSKVVPSSTRSPLLVHLAFAMVIFAQNGEQMSV